MESVDIQLKIQALEMVSDALKNELKEQKADNKEVCDVLKSSIKLVDDTSKTKIEDFDQSLKDIIEKNANDKKSVVDTIRISLRDFEEKLEQSITAGDLKSQSMDNAIIDRVSKIEAIFSFEGIAKRVLLLASIFGAIQVLVQYGMKLFR